MAHEKKYTAKQAAFAVLQKTQELLEKSELLKKEHKHIGWDKLHGKLEREGYSKESADKIAGSIKAKVHPMKKDDSIANSINAAVHSAQEARGSAAPPPLPKDVASSISGAFGKSEPAWKKPEADADQHAEGKGPKGEIKPHEKEQAPSDNVESQKSPGANPKEQAEGNNELAGTTPNQVGQDGKNIAGFDEMKGHLKLAKFIGHMEAKRKMKGGMANG